MENQTLNMSATPRAGCDGSSVVIKQEPEDNCPQAVDNHSTDGCDIKELDVPVINITPTVDNIEEKCKIEDTLKVKPEFYLKECALFETSSLPAVKCENDSKVSDSQQSIKIVRCESLQTGVVQDDDQLSQLREVSGAIDCKDGINSHNDDFGAVMETGEEQRDTDVPPRFPSRSVDTQNHSDQNDQHDNDITSSDGDKCESRLLGYVNRDGYETSAALALRCKPNVEKDARAALGNNSTLVNTAQCKDISRILQQNGAVENDNLGTLGTGEKPYVCSECGKSFKLQGLLTRHQSIHSGEKPYTCNECSKSFKRQDHLTRHQRIHSGARPYDCNECAKSFKRQDLLTRHQRIHSGEKPYDCNECAKSFKRKDFLTSHQRIHSEEKPYACNDCGKSFKRQKVLTGHQRIHSEEKPYDCNECGKSFKRQGLLTRHQRIHSGEKTYDCHECDQPFKRQGVTSH